MKRNAIWLVARDAGLTRTANPTGPALFTSKWCTAVANDKRQGHIRSPLLACYGAAADMWTSFPTVWSARDYVPLSARRYSLQTRSPSKGRSPQRSCRCHMETITYMRTTQSVGQRHPLTEGNSLRSYADGFLEADDAPVSVRTFRMHTSRSYSPPLSLLAHIMS